MASYACNAHNRSTSLHAGEQETIVTMSDEAIVLGQMLLSTGTPLFMYCFGL